MAAKVIMRAEGDSVGQRLDAALATRVPENSRQAWHELIADGRVSVNDQVAKPSRKLAEGDEVVLSEAFMPAAVAGSGQLSQDTPVIYRDDDVIVIDKPAGVLVHATERDGSEPTLASHFAALIEQDGSTRAGIVHRLDKDTSGVMVLARTLAAADDLRAQFQARSVTKRYQALVWGKMADKRARIELPMARSRATPTKMAVTPEGKPAVTEYEVVREYGQYSLLDVHIMTGRMHQIRVHLAYLGHPVVGDDIYGSHPVPTPLKRQFLHAGKLELTLPGGVRRSFESALPVDLQAFLEGLG